MSRTVLRRLFIPGAGLALLLSAGVLHGVQTDRWGDTGAISRASASLEAACPPKLGSWRGEPVKLSERQLKVAGATGATAARYLPTGSDARSNASAGGVDVMLLCGPHGPIAVHPPTVCFRSVGYRQCAEPRRVSVTDDSGRVLGTFWSTEFERTVDGLPERIRTWWAWGAEGRWSAPGSPRLAFAGERVLHKLYLTESAASAEATSLPTFARQFLPHLESTLFTAKR